MQEINYRRAIVQALDEELERDGEAFIMGIDIGDPQGPFLATKGLKEKYGERVRDTPINENAFTGAALGAASLGARAIVEIQFSNFMFVAMDQIANHIAKYPYVSYGQIELPLTIRTIEGGGHMGAGPQHSDVLHGICCSIPGLKVVCGSTPYDVKGLLKSAIRDDGPVMFFEHISLYQDEGEIPEDDYTVPLGEAKVEREGEDITVISTQLMLKESLKVAEELSEEGVEVEIINPRTLKPLDVEKISESVDKTNNLLIVDESPAKYGTQSGIMAEVVKESFYSLESIEILGAGNVPIPTGPLAKEILPTPEDIKKRIRKMT